MHVGVSVIPLGVGVQTNLDHLPHLVFNCGQVLFPFPPLDPVLQTRHVELNLLEGTAREMPLLRQVFEVVWLSLHAALQTYALRVKLKTALHGERQRVDALGDPRIKNLVPLCLTESLRQGFFSWAQTGLRQHFAQLAADVALYVVIGAITALWQDDTESCQGVVILGGLGLELVRWPEVSWLLHLSFQVEHFFALRFWLLCLERKADISKVIFQLAPLRILDIFTRVPQEMNTN